MSDKPVIYYDEPLHPAIFVERPNRFIIHCQLINKELNKPTGELVTVHLPDPGRLKELLIPGRKVWLQYINKPARKTQWSAVLASSSEGQLVSINTTLPNRLIETALKEKKIEELCDWEFKRAEYKFGDSRWDFLLESKDNKKMLLEVKSVTLAKGERGLFPDAVTKRGARHVQELSHFQERENIETVVLFVAQRNDVMSISPADHIDPAFAKALLDAKERGVTLLGRRCILTLEHVQLGESLPVYVK
ncbi:DNA/RNA nuclease SfsA [Thalassobacillus sp. C254]|uniref:DNA/RNA nuclease SfsA n=1 Tax=Thalassobacillus sp. C254 TaxID=1225341 RepID=UPI0006D0F750|nr:DNA/RNA nuclease SfsA [Thalassobacillus sp. C254]